MAQRLGRGFREGIGQSQSCMDAWYGSVMHSETRGFSRLKLKACQSILCSEHVGVPLVAGQAAQLQRAVQGSEVQENVPVSAAGAPPEAGLSLPAALAGARLGQGGFSSQG